MNVLSLFDGMSCGRIALERAGVSVTNYFASEIDKPAIKVAMHNYPDTKQLGDVTKWREWQLPQIDLLIGGSPCQGFSFAGKQLAFDDPRSKLFFEYVECLKHFKPKYFLLENVRMKKEHLQVITDMLGVEPIRINSNLVSAQNRDRYYWTNIPNVAQPEDKGIFLKDILLPEVDPKYLLGERQLSWLKRNLEFQLSKKYSAINPDRAITLVARMYANWAGNFIATRPSGFNEGGIYDQKSPPRTSNGQQHNEAVCFADFATGAAFRNQVTANGIESQINIREDGKSNRVVSSYAHKLNLVGGIYGAAIRGREIDGAVQQTVELNGGEKSNALTSVQKDALITDLFKIRKLTPVECERLQTVPDNYTSCVSDSQRYKMLGNGWTVDVIAHMMRVMSSALAVSATRKVKGGSVEVPTIQGQGK